MKILIIAGRKTNPIIKLMKSFEENGFEKVEFMGLKNISMITKGSLTAIEDSGIKVENFDAVFISADLKLTSFIGPLLDELDVKGIYTQVKPDSYYICQNHALQSTLLNDSKIRVSRSVIFSSLSLVKPEDLLFKYPVICRFFSGSKKIQSIVVDSPVELNSIVKGLKTDIDMILLKEFIASDVYHCAVIGDDIFVVERKLHGKEIEPLARGRTVKLSEKDAKTVIRAARICKCDVATVKICKGHVTDVLPDIDFSALEQKFGTDLLSSIAKLYREKINELREKRGIPAVEKAKDVVGKIFGAFRGA